ncbi:MAG: glycosyltransferase family A protein [Bacteroidales bacterium]|jgi:glycosyltransferase involved in cell wall biosynthesis|nr:glycosyltransferase family A protein [Bacteroidales bacterium]MDD3989170.1 glycosyltransferase family A protein [Bacteroidales bacterium]
MSSPFLTIIIPVYNVENYIVRCLESVLGQDYSDFELILSDDGSTDNSGRICDEYSARDSRIMVIHKENGGAASARNAALNIARGTYITFVDADDSLGPGSYSSNISILIQNPGIDMLQYPMLNYRASGMNPLTERLLCGEEEIFEYWWEASKITSSVCDKIFRKEIFTKIRFPEGKFYEDHYLITDFTEILKQVYISEKGCYIYTNRRDSTSSSPDTLKQFSDFFEAHFKVYKKLCIYKKLRPYKVTAFARVYRKLISARQIETKANLDSQLEKLKEYMPGWGDILASNSELKEKIWYACVKMIGMKGFMNLYVRYLKFKNP